MNMQTADYWLNPGTLAYYDGFRAGIVTVRIESVTSDGDIVATVTARKNKLYARGDIITASHRSIVPRPCLYRSRQRCGQYMIRPYRWVQP